jgi:hypothetical protein
MIKKLNIIEAMKMPIGTEFNVEYKDTIDDSTISIKGGSGGTKIFIWADGERLALSDRTLKATFIPIQQPVNFMQVIESDKRCRVEHEIMHNLSKQTYCNENAIKDDVNDMLDGKYMSLDKILSALSWKLGADELSAVIKKGKWYLEE